MEISPTSLILVGVVCLILGFLASVLISTLSEESESPAEGGEDAPPGGRKGRYTPVARIWRERGDGMLVVEMDGKSFVAPDPLTDLQRENLVKSVQDLAGWLKMPPADLESSRPPARAAAAAVRPETAVVDQERAAGASSTTPPKPAASRPTPVPPPPARAASPIQPGRPKGKDEAPGALSAQSMVAQIEDLLQARLAGTPLAGREIHLSEDPIRGVIVQVGSDYYEGIESVPDAEIKSAIRSAVQEWEKSQ